MLFNLAFVNNTVLSCYFLIIELYFLIPAVREKNFNPIAEPVIVIGTSSNDAKSETKICLVTAESKIRKCSI